MRVVVLGSGTSQGIPIIGCKCDVCQSEDPHDKRLRSSVWVQYKKISFVIDTSADFRQQMLRENVQCIDFVLLTHAHKDHIGGMDDIRSFNYLQNKPMDVYADKRTCKAITAEFHYAFHYKPYPGAPQLNLIKISDHPFHVKGVEIQPIRLIHNRLPILGFRIGNFAYITDASYIPDQEWSKLNGLDLLIINALRTEIHDSHFNLAQAVEAAQKIKSKRTVFTHVGHQMGLYARINSSLAQGMELAFDQMSINV